MLARKGRGGARREGEPERAERRGGKGKKTASPWGAAAGVAAEGGEGGVFLFFCWMRPTFGLEGGGGSFFSVGKGVREAWGEGVSGCMDDSRGVETDGRDRTDGHDEARI